MSDESLSWEQKALWSIHLANAANRHISILRAVKSPTKETCSTLFKEVFSKLIPETGTQLLWVTATLQGIVKELLILSSLSQQDRLCSWCFV